MSAETFLSCVESFLKGSPPRILIYKCARNISPGPDLSKMKLLQNIDHQRWERCGSIRCHCWQHFEIKPFVILEKTWEQQTYRKSDWAIPSHLLFSCQGLSLHTVRKGRFCFCPGVSFHLWRAASSNLSYLANICSESQTSAQTVSFFGSHGGWKSLTETVWNWRVQLWHKSMWLF